MKEDKRGSFQPGDFPGFCFSRIEGGLVMYKTQYLAKIGLLAAVACGKSFVLGNTIDNKAMLFLARGLQSRATKGFFLQKSGKMYILKGIIMSG
jgi:hypothetical protein